MSVFLFWFPSGAKNVPISFTSMFVFFFFLNMYEFGSQSINFTTIKDEKIAVEDTGTVSGRGGE